MDNRPKLKVVFLSTSPLDNKRNWSGTMFKMYEALQAQGFELEWIQVGKYTAIENRLFRCTETLHKKIFNRGFNKNHFWLKAWLASKKVQRRLQQSDAEFVFAPTYIAELAFLKSSKPLIYLNDATFHQLLNYYGGMSGFGWLSKKTTVSIERKALRNADALIFSSEWAAKHAVSFYHISPDKVSVVKFGSNTPAPEFVTEKDYSKGFNFLFLAVDWRRKGGQIALETVQILRRRGHQVKLHVVGCTPPVEDTEVMHVVPFLNKNNPAEAKMITDFLEQAHFVFMPTRADCTPISFCEAASYGLPVISTDIGGVSAVVEHGKTGLLLPLEADAKAYADEIEQLLRQPAAIAKMAVQAREKYESELNWDNWVIEFTKIVNHICRKQ